jgi:acetyl-CoA carboxylase carboxyltransferase component
MLTAREHISKLLDPGVCFLEIGLLIAYDQYDGQAPAAGVVTGIGKIEGRPAVLVANASARKVAHFVETAEIEGIIRAGADPREEIKSSIEVLG